MSLIAEACRIRKVASGCAVVTGLLFSPVLLVVETSCSPIVGAGHMLNVSMSMLPDGIMRVLPAEYRMG